MKGKTYRVHLTKEDKKRLEDIAGKGVHPARQVRRARILLLPHEGTYPAGKPGFRCETPETGPIFLVP
jgi:hypothetical protein